MSQYIFTPNTLIESAKINSNFANIGNSNLSTTAGDIGGAWLAYTPVLTGSVTNPTLGSGNVAEGLYTRIGNTIIYDINLKFGTSGTNAGSGNYYISLPVNARTSMTLYTSSIVGYGRAIDASTSYGAVFFPELETNSTIQLVYYPGIGGTAAAVAVSHSAPWSWTTSDTIFNGRVIYEAA